MSQNSNSNLDLLLKNQPPPTRQRRQRTQFTDESIEQLDMAFQRNPYPDINEREQLAKTLSTTEDRIQVWFQNKRARYRKKKTTSKCEQVNKENQLCDSGYSTSSPINNNSPVYAITTPYNPVQYTVSTPQTVYSSYHPYMHRMTSTPLTQYQQSTVCYIPESIERKRQFITFKPYE